MSDLTAATRPACEPWCNAHQTDVNVGTEQWCRSHHQHPAYGELFMELSSSQPRRPIIGLYGLRDLDLSLDDAERLGRALLDMVSAGRGESTATAEQKPSGYELDAAMRLGMMATAHLATLAGHDVRDIHEAGELLTAAERDELLRELRWILLKRRAADVYPGVTP